MDNSHNHYYLFAKLNYVHKIAPSAPRNVTARLVKPLLAKVSWRVPTTPNGIITHYTVYATPHVAFDVKRRKRQTAHLPEMIRKVCTEGHREKLYARMGEGQRGALERQEEMVLALYYHATLTSLLHTPLGQQQVRI